MGNMTIGHGFTGDYPLCTRFHRSDSIYPEVQDERCQSALDKRIITTYHNVMGKLSKQEKHKAEPQTETESSSRRKYSSYSMILIKAENILFRIPRAVFEKNQSAAFQQMYSYTSPSGEGGEEALDLHDIKADDFRAFLKCVMKPSDDDSAEQWLTTLKLANQWGFQKIGRDAFTKFLHGTKDVVRQVEVAKSYGEETWIHMALSKLAHRKEMLSEVEAQRIGWEYAFPLFRVRQAMISEQRHIVYSLLLSTYDRSRNTYQCCFCRNSCSGFWIENVNCETEKPHTRTVQLAIAKEFFGGRL